MRRLRPLTAALVGIVALSMALTAPTASAARTPRRDSFPVACKGCPAPVPLPAGAWHPHEGQRWQIQLQATSASCSTGGFDTSVSGAPYGGGSAVTARVYAIDLYADDGMCPAYVHGTPNADAVAALHAVGDRAIAYISAGSWEQWRPDAAAFVRYDRRCSGCLLGNTLGGYPDERFFNIARPKTRHYLLHRMRIRMQRAANAGFDGVYFDNQDEYHWADTGFAITPHDQLMYLSRLLNVAHGLGLAAGPNNDIVQTARFVAYADLQINESCFRYTECWFMSPMLRAGKPVFQIEYRTPMSAYCPSAVRKGFSTIRKKPSLYDLPWISCR